VIGPVQGIYPPDRNSTQPYLIPPSHLLPRGAVALNSQTMSSRLSQILSHLIPSRASEDAAPRHPPWYHPLNPTYFLPRAASIYGSAQAVQHRTASGIDISRTYNELSSRAAGLAYFLREEMKLNRGDRVAIVSPNTPMFLESFFGIAGAGCIGLCINYRLTEKGKGPSTKSKDRG